MELLSRASRLVRTVLVFKLFILAMVGLALFSVVTLRRYSDRVSGPLLRWWGRVSLRLLGLTMEVQGARPFAARAPRVSIVNHLSTLDVVVASAICPDAFSCVGKRELRWVFPFNVGWWSLRLYYIDRKNHESALKTLDEAAADMVARGRTVMMAPEGTRSPDGRMGPFKKGAFHLALRARLPIYPIVFAGLSEAMPKGALVPRPGAVKVRFLPPVETRDWRPEELNERIAEVHGAMDRAYHELRDELGLPDLRA